MLTVSNRQRHQLAFVSELATDIAHIPGLKKVVADALTCQYDDEHELAIVHSIAHKLSDVDLSKLALEQLPIDEEPASSPNLEYIHLPGTNRQIVCNTSLGKPPSTSPRSSSASYLQRDPRFGPSLRKGDIGDHRQVLHVAEHAMRHASLG